MKESHRDIPDSLWDENIILLSTDWFRGFWALFGLSFDQKTADKIQQAAQESVKEMMTNSKIYWFIDMSEKRINSTKDSFLKKLTSNNVSHVDIERLHRTMDALTTEIREDTNSTLWNFDLIVGNVARPSLNYPLSRLPSRLHDVVQKEGEASYDPESFDPSIFDEYVRESKTPWDCYIKSISDDLPELTSDLAQFRYRHLDGFRGKWMRISSQLDAKERKSLIDWLIKETKRYSHPDFEPKLPEWMAEKHPGKS